MHRLLLVTSRSVFMLSALVLSGCFNNVGDSEGLVMKTAQSNGANLDDSGFLNETGDIHLDASLNSALIGTYFDSGSTSEFGIMLNLKRGLDGAIGADSVRSILATIDTNTTMQQRKVIIDIPQFGIKATTNLGKLAAMNGKKLRNIMNIRPRFVRVDLTTSGLDVPENPSVLQLRNSNKTVITYGGKIEGDFVRRMMVLIPFAGANASFLPSASALTYGDGFPSAAPEETVGSVKLVRVTPEIASRFTQILTNKMYGPVISTSVQSEAIRAIAQTYGSLALAVHTTGTKVDAAYLININPANTSGPEVFPFCHSGYNDQWQYFEYGAGSGFEYDYPLACECEPGKKVAPFKPEDIAPPPSTTFVDHCPEINNKVTLVNEAVARGSAAPTSGKIIPPSAPVSDIQFEVKEVN